MISLFTALFALAAAFVRWRHEVGLWRLRALNKQVAEMRAELEAQSSRETVLKEEKAQLLALNQKQREEFERQLKERDQTIEQLRKRIEELEGRLNAILQQKAIQA